jgi:hypothetical protein
MVVVLYCSANDKGKYLYTVRYYFKKYFQLSWTWWYTPVIPATQEVEVGGSKLKASPDKIR